MIHVQCVDVGSLGWESSVPCGVGTTPWASPGCSIRTVPAITVRVQRWEKVVHSHGVWFRLEAGEGGGLQEGHVSCLDLAPGISKGWLLPTLLASPFSVFLASAFGKDVGSSCSTLSPGSPCCTWFWHFLFFLSCPSQNMWLVSDLCGEEPHLYRSNLMPIRSSQSEGVGHSPQCTPCYNSLNQVTFSWKTGKKL